MRWHFFIYVWRYIACIIIYSVTRIIVIWTEFWFYFWIVFNHIGHGYTSIDIRMSRKSLSLPWIVYYFEHSMLEEWNIEKKYFWYVFNSFRIQVIQIFYSNSNLSTKQSIILLINENALLWIKRLYVNNWIETR